MGNDKDGIDPMEWLRMVKKDIMSHFWLGFYLQGEASKWWKSLDNDTRIHSQWEEFEKLFSRRRIKDSKMEAMNKINDELKEEK